MKAPSHFVDVRCLPMDGHELTGSDIAFAMSRMVKVVHDMRVNHFDIAIDLPELKSAVGGNALGSLLRVFGDPAVIESFLKHATVNGLRVSEGVSVGPVTPVPFTQAWVTLTRSKNIDRTQPGWVKRSQRRLERRAIARGDDPSKIEKLKGRETHLLNSASNQDRRVPFLNLTSRSTGFKFMLFMNRKEAETNCGTVFDSYGLAARSEDGKVLGCLPSF